MMFKNKNTKHPTSAKNIWFFESYKESTYCYILSNFNFQTWKFASLVSSP